METCFRGKEERKEGEGGRERNCEKSPSLSVLRNTRTSKSHEIMVLFASMKFPDLTMREIRHPNGSLQSKVLISDRGLATTVLPTRSRTLTRKIMPQKLTLTLIILI